MSSAPKVNVLTIGRGSGNGDQIGDGTMPTSRKASRAAARASKVKTSTTDPSSGSSPSGDLPPGKTASTPTSLGPSKPNLQAPANPTGDIISELEITAYSQQSRFYRETFDANTTEVDIKGVNISIGVGSATTKGGGKQRDILVDAHLRFKRGVRYGMVGQNGAGKSVLLNVLSNNLLVGLPQNIKFLHVAQLEDYIPPGRTILDEVVECDRERIAVIRELKALHSAFSASKIPLPLTSPTTTAPSVPPPPQASTIAVPPAIKQAVSKILLSRSLVELDLAKKIATKRSGQRGYEARQKLLEVEASHRDLLRKLGFGAEDAGTGKEDGGGATTTRTAPAAETRTTPSQAEGEEGEYLTRDVVRTVLQDVLGRYEASGGSIASLHEGLEVVGTNKKSKTLKLDLETEMEERAKTVLKSVGFSAEEIGEYAGAGYNDKNDSDEQSKAMAEVKKGKELKTLSGGWKMRVVLAKAMFMNPDVLLLDEPTNHLDLPSILWLTYYLSTQTPVEQTIVVVSHDRDFLSAVTEETIIFKDRKLTYHKGNYEDWERTVNEGRRRFGRLKELEDKKKKQIMASIQKNVQQAKATGDDKRLGMVASRKKALDRLGMQRLESGKRHKVSYHGERAEIVIEEGFKTLPIVLPEPYEVPFHSSAILQLSEVSFRYKTGDKANTSNTLVLNNVSLDISPHARIAFLGPNGCGKSTLMNVLAGVLKPSKGEVKKHHKLRVGYFSQHMVDQLDLEKTAFEVLKEMYDAGNGSGEFYYDGGGGGGGITEQQARAHFASVGITVIPSNSGSTAKGSGGSKSQEALMHQPIRTLSGGQRNRVALGLVTFHQPHVLLLDEITNHLDVGSVESVVDALRSFEGAVVVVSHDMWFLRCVVEGVDDEDEDEDDGERGDEGVKEGGVFYVVNPKSSPGGLVRWEKGLDAYVEKERKRAEKKWAKGE